MTLYLEGEEPAIKKAGECYYMPGEGESVASGKNVASFKKMSGVNSGYGDAIMIDLFRVPEEKPEIKPIKFIDPIKLIEPGHENFRHCNKAKSIIKE